MDNIDKKNIEERIRNATQLELVHVLQEAELYDAQKTKEVLDNIHLEFSSGGHLMEEIGLPVFTSMIDGLFELKCFKGFSRKLGLSSSRVIMECRSFNYEDEGMRIIPDARVEYRNEIDNKNTFADENRPTYVRKKYENTNSMDAYKNKKIAESGGRKNIEDEYRKTKDITARKNNPDHRRNDPKNEHNAETDHIVPLNVLYKEMKDNIGLSDRDIKEIANQDYNFAVTGRLVNNPKRDMTNAEFIARQDELKKQGKPYVHLSEEQRQNMIQMDKEAHKAINKNINETIIKNLKCEGLVDRKDIKEAIKKKEEEIGRKLSTEERSELNKKLSRDKTIHIYGTVGQNAGKQTLMYTMGSAILFMVKPLYYEVADMFSNGIKEGVNAATYKEAFKIRFSRVRTYVWNQLKTLSFHIGNFMDMIKSFISALVEGIIGMFVGLLKKVIKIIKEGVKVFTNIWPVLFGEKSKQMTSSEKGDAIIKVLGGSVIALCGIGIDMLIEKIGFIPEDFKIVVSTILTGLATTFFFYSLDKADFFNLKIEKRQARINEIFNERIKDIVTAQKTMNITAIETMRIHHLKFKSINNDLLIGIESNNIDKINEELLNMAKLFNINIPYKSTKEFCKYFSTNELTL